MRQWKKGLPYLGKDIKRHLGDSIPPQVPFVNYFSLLISAYRRNFLVLQEHFTHLVDISRTHGDKDVAG